MKNGGQRPIRIRPRRPKIHVLYTLRAGRRQVSGAGGPGRGSGRSRPAGRGRAGRVPGPRPYRKGTGPPDLRSPRSEAAGRRRTARTGTDPPAGQRDSTDDVAGACHDAPAVAQPAEAASAPARPLTRGAIRRARRPSRPGAAGSSPERHRPGRRGAGRERRAAPARRDEAEEGARGRQPERGGESVARDDPAGRCRPPDHPHPYMAW